MIPIRTNIWPDRTPYANYALIAANVLVFLVTFRPQTYYIPGHLPITLPVHGWAYSWMLTPVDWRYWQFLTYAFLHGGWLHIIGNMFFLYIFGNNVNDKLGHLGYVGFYLAGAVFSGIGHALLQPSSMVPTVGASGAVAAVTGAYLVLFPQSLITVLYWFFFLFGTIDIPALYFIVIKMILIDNAIGGTSEAIAYDAHLAGYAYGIGVTSLLLASGLVSSNHFDLWAMVVRWNRRRRYRDVVAEGYDPFGGAKPIQVTEVEVPKTAEQAEKDARAQVLRSEISEQMSGRNLSRAAQVYLDLMALDDQQVLARQMLLDIANQLASEKRHAEAARAYEQFLAHYGTCEHAEQVMLMLGLLYSRYLAQSEPGIRYLRSAEERLTDPSQRQLCRDELARLGA